MVKPVPAPADPLARVRARYDAAASRWQQGLDRLGYCAAYLDFMSRAAPCQPQGCGRVLDVGTGTGAFAAAWAARAGRAERLDLLDISEPMLAQARHRLAGCAARIETINGPLGAQDVPAGAYDTVLCAHVVEHLPDPGSAIGWLATRLRPGGLILLAVSQPHWCTILLRLRWRNRSIRPDRVKAMLDRAGLGGVEVLPFASGAPRRTSCGYGARADKEP